MYFVALRYYTVCSRVIQCFSVITLVFKWVFFSSYVIVKSCFSPNSDTEQIGKNLHTLVFSYVRFGGRGRVCLIFWEKYRKASFTCYVIYPYTNILAPKTLILLKYCLVSILLRYGDFLKDYVKKRKWKVSHKLFLVELRAHFLKFWEYYIFAHY